MNVSLLTEDPRWSSLKGPVTVFHSTRARVAKVHLDSSCEGLSSTPECARSERTYMSLMDLLMDESTRPCRMCSLAACLVAAALIDPEPARGAQLMTFSSQAAPGAFDGNRFSFNYAESTPSGRERLVSITTQLKWPLVSTSVGPVSAAVMSARLAHVFSRNLRAVHLGTWTGDKPVPLGALEVLWTLLVDTPPELDEASPSELWRMALLLA